MKGEIGQKSTVVAYQSNKTFQSAIGDVRSLNGLKEETGKVLKSDSERYWIDKLHIKLIKIL